MLKFEFVRSLHLFFLFGGVGTEGAVTLFKVKLRFECLVLFSVPPSIFLKLTVNPNCVFVLNFAVDSVEHGCLIHVIWPL